MQSAGGLERNLLALAISAADLRGQVVLAPIESVSVIILPSINISFLAVRPARTPARPPIVVIRTLAPSERRASVRLLISSPSGLSANEYDSICKTNGATMVCALATFHMVADRDT